MPNHLFGTPQSRAQLIHQQEVELSQVDKMAEHLHSIHALLEEAQNALSAADPKPHYEQATLDPVKEITIRYGQGRYRYALFTTEAAGTKINVALQSGLQFLMQTTAPGWVALDLPPGTRLFSGDANNHVVLVRISNLKV